MSLSLPVGNQGHLSPPRAAKRKQHRTMKGLTVSSLKGHPSLIPLFVCVGAGVVGAGYYIMRLSTRCPDVSWNKRDEIYPWNKLSPTYQYKFYSPKRDYKAEKAPAERPEL